MPYFYRWLQLASHDSGKPEGGLLPRGEWRLSFVSAFAVGSAFQEPDVIVAAALWAAQEEIRVRSAGVETKQVAAVVAAHGFGRDV